MPNNEKKFKVIFKVIFLGSKNSVVAKKMSKVILDTRVPNDVCG